MKRAIRFIYDAGDHPLTNLVLHGSWNLQTGQPDPSWPSSGVAMQSDGHGRWSANIELEDNGGQTAFEWGVVADGPTGPGQWALLGEGNETFQMGPGLTEVEYAPTHYHRMGARRMPSGDLVFRFWAPNAKDVQLEITGADDDRTITDMHKGEDDLWTVTLEGGWAKHQGKPYGYQVTTSDGQTVFRRDPYARDMQGEQRGLSRTFIDTNTGEQTHPYHVNPEQFAQLVAAHGSYKAAPIAAIEKARAASRRDLLRFEATRDENDTHAVVVLKDESGPLSKVALLERLDAVHPHSALEAATNDAGEIAMVDLSGTWTVCLHPVQALAGLSYEIRIYEQTPEGLRIEGDENRDAHMSPKEIARTPHNDRWSDVIRLESGVDYRTSLITEPTHVFKHDDVPRERDPNRWVIYQLHVGSFFGKGWNANRSHLGDIIEGLGYLKSLGVNAIELLPVYEFEGIRDWGYAGVTSLGVEAHYGFIDDDGREVRGSEALMRFIDAAHAAGINVIADIVYNHSHGDHNDLWQLDGPENPYFNWSKDPQVMELRDTDWGAMPAYWRPQVFQFLLDHAVDQVATFHFDGLRMDFTEPMKAEWGGGGDGWRLIRAINRQAHFFNPHAYTIAEQFDYDPHITYSIQPGEIGGGFDAQWYTEIQHRCVRDKDPYRPGWIQAVVAGGRTQTTDALMHVLANGPKLESWAKGVSVISNHDEVGNAERTVITGAGGHYHTVPSERARGLSRLVAGLGLTGPGTPLFFQGDEFLADNRFSWGRPNTWDLGWQWRDLPAELDPSDIRLSDALVAVYRRLSLEPPVVRRLNPRWLSLTQTEQRLVDKLADQPPPKREPLLRDVARQQMFRFFRDMIAFRNDNPALWAASPVHAIYTHNDDYVLAFTRGEDRRFVVIGNARHVSYDQYRVPLPPGRWKECFNSDATYYGGAGTGNFGATLDGGLRLIRLPAHGLLVLERM